MTNIDKIFSFRTEPVKDNHNHMSLNDTKTLSHSFTLFFITQIDVEFGWPKVNWLNHKSYRFPAIALDVRK